MALSVVALSADARQAFPKPSVPAPKTAAPAAPAAPQPQAPNAPTAATLGVPLYPSAVYLKSYDAGRGQRFYLFG